MEDPFRTLYFSSLLSTLQKASLNGYDALFTTSYNKAIDIDSTYALHQDVISESELCRMPQDMLSLQWLPQNETVLPLKCFGDGNCLFRSVSIILCGKEHMHIELRVRTLVELVLNSEHYLQDEVVEFLSGEIGSDDQVSQSTHQSDRRLLVDQFQSECLETAKLGTYGCMWHVHALSTVIQHPIASIYPELNLYARRSHHKTVQPRAGLVASTPVYIMWTRTRPVEIGKPWSPNHFVPCVETKNVHKLPSSSTRLGRELPSATSFFLKKTTPKHKGKYMSIKKMFLPQSQNLSRYVQPEKPLSSIVATNKTTNQLSPVVAHAPSVNTVEEANIKCAEATVNDQQANARSVPVSLHFVAPSSQDQSSLGNSTPVIDLTKESTWCSEDSQPLTGDEDGMESEQSPSSYSPEGKLQLQTIPPTLLKNTASCSQLSNTSDIMDQKSCTEEHFDSDDSWESGYEHSTPTSPETELQFFSQTHSPTLPFLNFSRRWYIEENMHFEHSLQLRKRDKARKSNPVVRDGNFKLLKLERGQMKGTIESNVLELEQKLCDISVTSKWNQHYKAVIEVGRYILGNGPLIRTGVLGEVYSSIKGTKPKHPAEYFEIFSRYLNIIQIYISDSAYIMPNVQGDIAKFIETVNDTVNSEGVVRDTISKRLAHLVVPSLQYMDTHRDRQVLKALIAELTSVKFTAEVLGLKSRQGVTSAKSAVSHGLARHLEIKKTSQIVRSDLTTRQQYELTQRIISKRKKDEIKTIATGRGRKLKIEHFPELSIALSYAFGELDVSQGGGGLESHPRLSTGTLYRGEGNATTMLQAREVLLQMAPSNFSISLSSCYNYTQNFREGTHQAKQHHAGRDINSLVCLKRPPRTGVPELVVNLHWSTANVNNYLNRYEKQYNCAVVSKDAKAVILADISPVQKPGPSWKARELPDHSWDQSRTYAVTPMTFLIMDTQIKDAPNASAPGGDVVKYITRSGQGATLLYLSFFEPDTTFKCMNEIFYLTTLPELYHLFEEPNHPFSLKKHFIFVVDNGPQEKPANPLVQMCMVRIMRVLNLEKITQVSFAEYHSKRNFVERLHAEENRVLSSHGPYCSTMVHPNVRIGSEEHRENMEAMCAEIEKTLQSAKYAQRRLVCHRGLEEKDYLFSDEEELTNFLSLSETQKSQYSPSTYITEKSPLIVALETHWHIEGLPDFTGSYSEDYDIISVHNSGHTCWKDKYTVTLRNPNQHHANNSFFEIQPLPDYIRWLKCLELHYMPWEESVTLSQGKWQNIPGLFLPSTILELCYTCTSNPPSNILKLIALLSWLPLEEVEQFFEKKRAQSQATIDQDIEKVKWKEHKLNCENKDKLVQLARDLKIPVVPSMSKTDLIKVIAKALKEEAPQCSSEQRFTGKLKNLPKTTTGLARLTAAKLRSILHFYAMPTTGNKEELTLRVFYMIHGQFDAVTAREEEKIKDLIKLVQHLMIAQRSQAASKTTHTFYQRTFTTRYSNYSKLVHPPSGICEANLQDLFSPFIDFLEEQRKERATKYLHTMQATSEQPPISLVLHPPHQSEDMADIGQVGAKVQIRWTQDEIGDSGWKAGWYSAYVQCFDESTDTLTITYPTEPGCVYHLNLSTYISTNKIKLVRPAF